MTICLLLWSNSGFPQKFLTQKEVRNTLKEVIFGLILSDELDDGLQEVIGALVECEYPELFNEDFPNEN